MVVRGQNKTGGVHHLLPGHKQTEDAVVMAAMVVMIAAARPPDAGTSAVAKSRSGRSAGRSASSIHRVALRESGAVSHHSCKRQRVQHAARGMSASSCRLHFLPASLDGQPNLFWIHMRGNGNTTQRHSLSHPLIL